MKGKYSAKRKSGKGLIAAICAAVVLILALAAVFLLPKQDSEVPLPSVLPGILQSPETTAAETEAPAQTGEPGATVPADGNPEDITCKGSYTVSGTTADVVASAGGAQLTNKLLQPFYWAEVAAYRQAAREPAPDFDKPLDTQECPISDTAVTWQQYFLQEALNTWHSAQALVAQSAEERPVTEEVFQQNEELHEKYLPKDVPAIEIMYGYDTDYDINKWHQLYLDSLPTVLNALAEENGFADSAALAAAIGTDAEALAAYADLYNRGYMFFTELSYDVAVTEDEVNAFRTENGFTNTEKQIDVRHLLVLPNPDHGDRSAEKCLTEAQNMLNKWKLRDASESTFAALANKESADTGTAVNGGLYSGIRKGQLTEALDAWCFDDARQAGDTTVIQTELGCHILYFCGSREIGWVEAETALLEQKAGEQIAAAKEKYPMEVNYSAIGLGSVEAIPAFTPSDILYPDIAHERYTQVPVYLQQDYRNAPYGDYWVSGHGCGITALAMLATYMADKPLTPAVLAAMYGEYCHYKGTDTTLFIDSPPQHDFYFDRLAFNWSDVQEALENGRQVIVLQFAGYFTTTGHFLVLENIREDGLITVRDSNIYNYTRLADHKIDGFKSSDIIPQGVQYWIYQEKILSIPGCGRCGGEGTTSDTLLNGDFCCEKCVTALTRRNAWLNFQG